MKYKTEGIGHPAAGFLRTGVTAAPDLAYTPPVGGNGVGTGLWWCAVACQFHGEDSVRSAKWCRFGSRVSDVIIVTRV